MGGPNCPREALSAGDRVVRRDRGWRPESHRCCSNIVAGVAPEVLAAEIRQLRDLTPAFGIRTLRGSIIKAAEQALEDGNDEAREIALQLLREVGKIPS